MSWHACRVRETIAGGRQYAEDAHKCPLHYARIPYEDIRERRALPYLLGGRQRPRCTNCNSNEPWARFCSWDYSQFSQCAPSSPSRHRCCPPGFWC